MYWLSRHRLLLLTLLVMIGGTVLCAVAAGHYAWRRALATESAQVQRQLQLYGQGLQQRIDRFGTLPQVMALDPDLLQALQSPLSAAERQRLNLKLQRANQVTRTSTLTLVGRDGVAVAASNWSEPASNVGEDYSYRPYYQQAMAHGRGRFYGIGMTTNVPGYFMSEAIVDAQGQRIGVIVIKIELSALEQEWLSSPDVVLASDNHDVVFLANRDAWRYRLLRPLGASERREMLAARQYADRSLQPLRVRTEDVLADGGRMVRLLDPALATPMLWQSLALEDEDWSLHLLHDASAAGSAGRGAAIAGAAAWLALGFLVLFVQQRRRLSKHRQRSRRELETLLKQHAQELRTAQDGLLQAATDADSGLSRSLEHLPQGVVVIDREQRLVAWNSRYVELFRFPAGLVRVGRPIEELFRFNARRGLLGPGPIDEAIERRLNHLRSGRPHMRESEKDDGTVLEIRGNPLPDGGFVTSYADITSYKNAARELRSLADALEHRVAERTHDLDEARREAEQANRYKTRFVASAVHDLLQPLNAARMFVSVLRGRLSGDARELSEHVDAALAAQDAILNSLLDISRLESRALQTRVRAFALSPLLETLAREFGMAAQSRGLHLDWVDTRAVVVSDEALLRRILQNFLSNALRYTPRGRVLIGCRRVGDHLRIEVHDQGPGIPESLQGEIFEEFRRLNDGVEQERGAGLGLAIVERIGRLLGHRISLRSTLGKGSVFAVSVPLGQAEDVAVPTPAPVVAAELTDDSPLRQCRVWSIDDDPRVCAATRALLERWGCNVELADGPQGALEIASALNVPQLLLLDVRMGQWHGPDLYEALCRLWQARPPVILVTAERDEALKAHAAEQGWGFLPKPVRPPALRALMTQLLLRHRG
ncbi:MULTISPECIES: PAS-domain containing protein [Stenotrophomonas]|uniref:PAS-domain containing protein n=1 Tax=Stenotrophomonas TaxID=40323 RepID=UPI000D54036E|nr:MULTISPECIES: PAS-domain containing protein [Stenotrophomonas]AWH30412.1 hybrid sensor histidine kinase/response regulator [Stenotrophomonas sp. YAU14A_MKIMI4_1]AWH34364.1 hybrid sensor histidine kinase/response regulator [Stenotrophomonas sp. SAU14A_NAIMI4_8]